MMIKRIYKKVFEGSFAKISGAALLLGAASLISRLLGIFRDRILAGTFGAGDELDIYYAAFRLPDLLFNLIVLGALSAGFIPVFCKLFYGQKQHRAWDLTNNVLNLLLVVLALASLVLFIFAPFLMKLLTPGFSGQKLDLVVLLTRIIAISPIFLGLSAVFSSMLQGLRRFFTYAVAPIFYNLGIICGALFLVPKFGLRGLAFGVVLGALFHFLVQLPSLRGTGYRYKISFDFRQKGILKMMKLMVPRFLSLLLLQANFLAITIVASFLVAGSLTVFNLAYNIWSFPLGVFATAFVVASFPTLSERASRGNLIGAKETLVYTLRQILFYLIPSSAVFIILRAQIVRIILGSGKFDWQDTILTIESLKFFTLGLFAEGILLLLTRAFFAFSDAKTPFFIGAVGSVFRIVGAWLLSLKMGAPGLALGFSIGAVVQMILLWVMLERKIGIFADRKFTNAGIKITLASFLAGLATWGGLYLGDYFVDTHTGHGLLMQTILAGILGVLAYLVVSGWFKLEETRDLIRALFEKVSFKRIRTQEKISDI